MLEVRNISKSYGDKEAVRGISFSVGEGEILGFLGPNGAGKSTTMNMITGYLGATEGEILFNGINILEDPLSVRREIGYLPEKPPLYQEMSVDEYLKFVYKLKKVALPCKEHLTEVCGLVGIENIRHRLIRNLSKGYQQRVGIAQALLGYPPLLILDEPTVGLDPKQIVEIRELITALGKKQTVILSTHILPEVQMVCKRIIVIHQGRLVADGVPDRLIESMESVHRLSVSVAGPKDVVRSVLAELAGVMRVNYEGESEPGISEFMIEHGETEDIRRPLFARMAKNGWPIMELRRQNTTLEELFLSLTTVDEEEG